MPKHAAEPLKLSGTFEDVWFGDTDASSDATNDGEGLHYPGAPGAEESQVLATDNCQTCAEE